MSARGKEPPASSTPAALAAFEQDEQLDRALAEVQQQVEVELTPKLATAAAQADARVQESRRVADYSALKEDLDTVAVLTDAGLRQQLAKAQEAIELAQAAAPVPPVPPLAVGGAGAGTSGSAFQNRLQSIVHRGHDGPGRALVIRTSGADAKAQGNLEEDLAVMSRILDK